MIVILNGDTGPDVESVLIYLDEEHSSYIETTELGEFTVVGMSKITYEQDRDTIKLKFE